MKLSEHQLEIMRRKYGEFARYHHDVEETKRDEQRYKDNPGYMSNPRGK